jgi:hypothetical protein
MSLPGFQQVAQQALINKLISCSLSGLFETFLEVALFYDHHQLLHTLNIKSSYPNSVFI